MSEDGASSDLSRERMNFEPATAFDPLAAMHLAPSGRLPTSKRALRLRVYAGLLVMDCVILIASFLFANLVRLDHPFAPAGLNILAVILPIYVMVAGNQGIYSFEIFESWPRNAVRAVASLAIATVAVLLISFYLQATASMSRAAFSIGVGTSAVLLFGCRRSARKFAQHILSGPHCSVIFIRDGLDVPGISADVICYDAALHGLAPDIRDPHMLDKIGRLLRRADKVVIGCPPERRVAWAMMLKGANVSGEVMVPEIDALGALGAETFTGRSTLTISGGPLNTRNRALKRLLDLSLAIGALVALAPLLAVAAIAIRLDSAGPIFFKQQRLGRGNRLFAMYKFRSMRADLCDASGNLSTARDDRRVTRAGRIIRATSIDELPQLLNILKGDMSFVGPRPHALGSLAGDKLFWEVDQRYWHRHACKPGLTGLAQIRGFRGATHAQSDLVNRLQADLEYLNGWSIWRDLHILVATFRVLRHKNAY
jgi:lipopolysaccharide/colanic/teichoic acid biosynthesis glycosyltransferase